jgi:opacity protein-like surface antigen
MDRSRGATALLSIDTLVGAGRRGVPSLLIAAVLALASAPADAATTALPSNAANAASGTRFSVGGGATGAWAADPGPTSGSTFPYGFSNRVDTSGIAQPAPDAIYQRSRFGTNFTYTVDRLEARARYVVRLHFVEPSWSGARRRIFDVSVNGSNVLRRFDIFAAAGGVFRAVTRSFTTEASSSGKITIAFSAVRDTAIVSGIEVARDTPAPAKVDIAANGAIAPRDANVRAGGD